MPDPVRIQRRRTKGWRMPDDTVSVCRPGPWGNPFVVTDKFATGKRVAGWYYAVPTAEDAVECFRLFLAERPDILEAGRQALRGKNLACFCRQNEPCHADVWLEVANA
jgi:hypothetical protein